jgi:hypothetical protein
MKRVVGRVQHGGGKRAASNDALGGDLAARSWWRKSGQQGVHQRRQLVQRCVAVRSASRLRPSTSSQAQVQLESRTEFATQAMAN